MGRRLEDGTWWATRRVSGRAATVLAVSVFVGVGVGVSAAVVVGATAGCTRGDPCLGLEQRLCADLGEACADFRASGAFRELTPDPAATGPTRLSDVMGEWVSPARGELCVAVGADPSYHRTLLPLARYRAELHRRPETARPPPRTVSPPPVESLAPTWVYYLPLVTAAMVLGRSTWRRWPRN